MRDDLVPENIAKAEKPDIGRPGKAGDLGEVSGWHCFSIYAKTGDHLAVYNALTEFCKTSTGISAVYVWYDGDLLHIEEPDLSNWDEIAARQSDKMSQPGTLLGARTDTPGPTSGAAVPGRSRRLPVFRPDKGKPETGSSGCDKTTQEV